jgi:hypothetical protein
MRAWRAISRSLGESRATSPVLTSPSHCPHRPVEASAVEAEPRVHRRVNAAASPERIKHCGVNAAVCAFWLSGGPPQQCRSGGLQPARHAEPTAYQAVVPSLVVADDQAVR